MGGDDEREIDVQSTAAAETDAAPQAPPPLEALFRDHHERVFHAAYRITGDAGDAEDVLQSVFLRLLRRAPEVVGATAGPYLHRAAVNAALDLLRGRRRASSGRSVEFSSRAPSRGLPRSVFALKIDSFSALSVFCRNGSSALWRLPMRTANGKVYS
jgi:RNA polymerase sigma factor (sigma-70 family)